MLGTYIGQFLPLGGGKLGGTLSLGGNNLTGVLNIADNASTTRFTLATTGIGKPLSLIDANGTTQLQIKTGSVVVNNQLTVGTTATASFSGPASFTGTTTFNNASKITGAGEFVMDNFSAATLIIVDPVNGSDATGTGTNLNPYASLYKAASVATSGDCIFLMPGVDGESNQIMLPAGVHLRGAGMDVSILKPTGSWSSNQSPFVVPGTGSIILDLTVDLTSSGSTNRPACIGCVDTATSGSAQFALNPALKRVKCINTYWGLQYTANNSTSSTSYLYLEECVFVSNTRCAGWLMTSDANFTADAHRCQFYFTFSSGVSASSTGECVFAEAKGNTRLFDCVLSMTDTTNTSWGSVSYQMIDSDAPLELYGCKCLTSFPNLPAIPPVSTAGTNPGFMLLSNTLLTKIGAGNTLSLPDSDSFSPSLYQLLPSPKSYPDVYAMTVSGSTATPVVAADDCQWEIAVDAATLTSNTLTIANVNVANNTGGQAVAIQDGQRQRFRVKNTNAASTSMTLAPGSSYNLGSTTLTALPAGKRAYLSFCYDADNSKWDLIGYSTGL